MEYKFRDIEKRWQQWWKDNDVYKVSNPSTSPGSTKPKYYVLDMFPYPSGAGLACGASAGVYCQDIYARFKRLKGFNVLHPMGYDAFGLPAEQYAIEHGIHPAVSTEKNIIIFASNLIISVFLLTGAGRCGPAIRNFINGHNGSFCNYSKVFITENKKAEPIEHLIEAFEKEGNKNHQCRMQNSRYEIPIRNTRKHFLQMNGKHLARKRSRIF